MGWGREMAVLTALLGGALVVASIAFWAARRRNTSLLGLPMAMPAAATLSLRLVLGSAVFGVGWGLAGFCPGPALVALGAGVAKAWGFVAAMLAGMAVFELIERAKLRRSTVDAAQVTRP